MGWWGSDAQMGGFPAGLTRAVMWRACGSWGWHHLEAWLYQHALGNFFLPVPGTSLLHPVVSLSTALLIFQGSLCGLSSSMVVRLHMWELASKSTTAEMGRPFLTLRPRTGTASLLPILLVNDHLDSMWGVTTERPSHWEAWFIRGGLWWQLPKLIYEDECGEYISSKMKDR